MLLDGSEEPFVYDSFYKKLPEEPNPFHAELFPGGVPVVREPELCRYHVEHPLVLLRPPASPARRRGTAPAWKGFGSSGSFL